MLESTSNCRPDAARGARRRSASSRLIERDPQLSFAGQVRDAQLLEFLDRGHRRAGRPPSIACQCSLNLSVPVPSPNPPRGARAVERESQALIAEV